MSESKPTNSARGAIAVGIGAIVLVLCCAGPALIAGGALGAMGATLGNPIAVAIGVALIVTAIAITLRRRAQHGAAKPGDTRS